MKRRITHLMIFLLLGAIINVTVAWACVLHCDLTTSSDFVELIGESDKPSGTWVLSVYTGWGAAHYTSYREFYFNTETEGDEGEFFEAEPTDPLPSTIAPAWTGLKTPLYSEDLFEDRAIEAWGWPMLCLNTEYNYNLDAENWELVSGIDVNLILPKHKQEYNDPFIDAFPFRPIWPGFAINTLLYAAFLWIFTLAPFQLRRIIRNKRGSCLKCGYDLNHADHDICPECGCVCIDCAK